MSHIIPIILIASALFVSGCIASGPPGCAGSSLGVTGGCSGKNEVKNFNIDGDLPSCITIRPHTCRGALIQIENLCNGTAFSINGKSYSGMNSYPLFVKTENGTIVDIDAHNGTIRLPGTIVDYPYPEEDEFISVDGIVNDKSFTLSYIRTKAQCA